MISSHLRNPARLAALSIVVWAVALSASASAQRRDERGITVSEVNSGVGLDKKGRLWAVVVGISNYANVPPKEQLRFAQRDAESFAAFLRSPNGGGFPSTQIKLLLNQTATLSTVRTALGTWLSRSVEPDDVVYIFFAGHGVVESESEGYLLAHDSDPQNLYATALSVNELDKIITERLRARIVVLIADACHAGQLGWKSRGAESQLLINRYLDEVGKSGKGVVRLLASRADERSYEDVRWGGGHGAFTHFLLEGLKGKADRDKDNVVRAAELIEYLSEVVPEATQALQHPRPSGSFDPKLPLAIIPPDPARLASNVSIKPDGYSLEMRGIPGSEVYIGSTYRGRIRPNGVLIIEGLQAGNIEVSIDPPGGESLVQTVSLAAPRTILELKAAMPVNAAVKSSPIVSQIKQTLARGIVLEPDGAWGLYGRLVRETPNEPQRGAIETELSRALEEIGQRAINSYIHSPITELKPDTFHRGAQAFAYLKTFRPNDPQLEAKYLFCYGRALVVDKNPKEAVEVLKKAISLDPRAGHCYNALGVAYEMQEKNGDARDAFKRAAHLAPQWWLPHFHIALQHVARGKLDDAEPELKTAVDLDPRYPYSRYMLARLYRETKRLIDAEREATYLLRMYPGYPLAYLELGLIYETNRDYKKSADAYEAFLRIAPNHKDSDVVRQRAARMRKQAEREIPRLRRP